jgi:hypothetical protein
MSVQPAYPAIPGYFVPSNKDLAPFPYGRFSPGARFEPNKIVQEVYEHDRTDNQSGAGTPTRPTTAQSPLSLTLEEMFPQSPTGQTPLFGMNKHRESRD